MNGHVLSGIKVLDFTTAAVGPFCSRILADMGAEVIKVERPNEAKTRRFTPEAIRPNSYTTLNLHCNGGKKSLCIDLKNPHGRELVQRLASLVDIVVENYTPHVLKSYGLDYPSIKLINPSVVMCSLTGYGQEGLEGNPDHPCTDPIAQAMGGMSHITGERDGAPYTVGGAIGDTTTAIQGALAIMFALFHRQRTGIGQHIDIAMVQSILFTDAVVMPYVAANKGATIHYRNGQQNTYTLPMGILKAKQGYIALQAPGNGPESAWGRLCKTIGRPELITDPRYRTDEDRMARTSEVVALLEEWLQTASDDEAALAVLAEARISSGPVLSQSQILAHPHFRKRGTFQIVKYPDLGPVEVVAPPYHFSETPARIQGRAPEAGEHNREILSSQLGLSNREIDALFKEGVLHHAEAPLRAPATAETPVVTDALG